MSEHPDDTNQFPTESAQKMLGQAGGMSGLVQCLQSLDYQVQRWAAFAIGAAVVLQANRKSFADGGGVKALVELLQAAIREKDLEAQRWVANIVAFLCLDNGTANPLQG